MDKINRQILFIDVFGLFIETANKATYDVEFLLSIIELAKHLCCNSKVFQVILYIDEFCVYLSNNGLFDYIQTCLTLRFDNEGIFISSFQCYTEIILNSCIG